jgi:hypothetical protein
MHIGFQSEWNIPLSIPRSRRIDNIKIGYGGKCVCVCVCVMLWNVFIVRIAASNGIL